MASIFISHSNKDRTLVSTYAELLRRFGHEVLMDDPTIEPGADWREQLIDRMQHVDGVIVFITENGIASKHVNSEIGLAFSYYSKNEKFLILLAQGSVSPPYIIQSMPLTQIDYRDPQQTIKEVDFEIKAFMRKVRNTPVPENRTTDAADFTADTFARQFYQFLSSLEAGRKFGPWTFKGATDVAYSTPEGSWEKDGFEIFNEQYSFIIRSVWDAGERRDASYLVVESNNLRGILANVALYNSDKFFNRGGEVTILETYDMTVGYGRRTRDEVREAFSKAGFPSNVITSFHVQEFSWFKVVQDILEWAVYREKAKLLIQQSVADKGSSASAGLNYWMLKVWGENWNLPGLKEGDECYFHSVQSSPDRPSFVLVKPGDKGIAYDFSPGRKAVFLFEVTKPLHPDEDRGEMISFVITVKPVKGLPFSLLLNHIDFWEQLNRPTLSKLYPLDEDRYTTIAELLSENRIEQPFQTVFNKPSLAEVFSDSAAKDIQDRLEFESDVNALSTVIAYREVQPPLAVGLFGNWGTGKSFFMNKLQQRIDELSRDKSLLFCEKVLQINFNSWHYSDSNLWASLITKIFEDLEAYGKQKPDELNELFKKLNSTKELLQETKNEKAKVDKEIETLTTQKKIFDDAVLRQANQLASLSYSEIFTDLLNDTSVQEILTG